MAIIKTQINNSSKIEDIAEFIKSEMISKGKLKEDVFIVPASIAGNLVNQVVYQLFLGSGVEEIPACLFKYYNERDTNENFKKIVDALREYNIRHEEFSGKLVLRNRL